MDNGSERISNVIAKWAYKRGVKSKMPIS